MLSKRSFFNRTLFRKNLARFWPMWGTAALLACLAPLYLLLGLLSNPRADVSPGEFAAGLYSITAEVVPVITLLYAIMAAMAVWGYLFSPRSVGLMHALPIDRNCLFVTGTLSGLAMLLIPYGAAGALVCLIALAWGFLDIGAVCVTAAAVVFMNLIFFGIATLCAMCTGHQLALPALYAVVNFFAVLAEELVRWVANGLLFGVSEVGGDPLLEFLSPMSYLAGHLNDRYYPGEAGERIFYLEGFGAAALYGLAGLALLGLSWVLCRRRQSEGAGDVAAFRWLKPLFRGVMAAAGALGLGPLLYMLVWESFFQRGFYTDPVPMTVCMALTGLVGYYAASMLLEKSLRVFRGSLPGALAVCLAAAALCAGLTLDPVGISSWIPETEDILDVQVYGEVSLHAGADSAALKEKAVALHKSILAEKNSILARSNRDTDDRLWMSIVYVLDSGRMVRRGYYLPMREEQWKRGESYEGLVREIANDREILREQFIAPEGYTLTDITAESDHGGEFYVTVGDRPAGTDPEKPGAEELYAALLQDIEEGNIPGWAPSSVGRTSARLPVGLRLYFGRPLPGEARTVSSSAYIELYESMVHTIQTMEDMGWAELLLER